MPPPVFLSDGEGTQYTPGVAPPGVSPEPVAVLNPYGTLMEGGAYELSCSFLATTFWPADWLVGPHYSIEPYVSNDGVYNTWRVVSDYGVWDVQGNERVVVLLREIGAIARLKEESQGRRYADALEASGKEKLDAAGRVFIDRYTRLRKCRWVSGTS